jgi:hypothetical protein
MRRGQVEPMWVIGWREWLALPELGIPWIKVKIDTGARSSALHAFDLVRFERDGVPMVRFAVHPYQRSARHEITVEAPVIDERAVKNSGGTVEHRPVILGQAELLGRRWSFDLTLTNRDEMGFRMLLGREALRSRFIIDPGRSYLAGTPPDRSPKKKKTKIKATEGAP